MTAPGARARTRDWQGTQRAYVRDGVVSARLKPLVRKPVELDPRGLRAAWGAGRAWTQSIVAGISELPTRSLPAGGELRPALIEAVARLPEGALALGGGVDAALILAILRCELDRPAPRIVTLRTGIPSYDEVDRACEIARAFGASCEVIDAPLEVLRALLPEAIERVEAPLYNLHPVGRLALAKHAPLLLTGDGADAACAGEPDLDSVPLLFALANAASPFFDPRVISSLLGRGKDPLRSLLQGYRAPSWLTSQPKKPRSLPGPDVRAETLLLCLDYLERE